MLILRRSKNETVVVETKHGDQITIKICGIEGHGSRVKLGFETSDDSITIRRSELPPHFRRANQ